MYPNLDLNSMMAMYKPKPMMQFSSMQGQQQQPQQQQSGGGANLIGNGQKLYNQFSGGMGGADAGGMVGGEAAPLGLTGDFGGAGVGAGAAGAEGLGAAGAGGMGAAGGAAAGGEALGAGAGGLGAGMGEGLGALFALFSDPRLKTDKHPVGKLNDGTPIWVFKYKGDPTPRIGLMADDVQRRHPEAVHERGGFKTVDYAAATKQSRAMGILGNIGKK